MRLNVMFLLLLLVATVATGLLWGDFAVARDGAPGARIVVLAAAPVALISTALLGRIVLKVSAMRQARRKA